MSCPLGAGQTRAQDSCRFRVSYDLLLGAANAPLFYFHSGAHSHNLNPGIMSRQINRKEAFLASVSPWPAGIAVSAGGFTRTADMALKSGSNTQVIPCPAVLFILRMRATETNSSICEVASLDCFGPASAF